MILNLGKKIFGTANQRYIKSCQKILDQVNKLEPKMKNLSDNELKAQTSKLKAKIKQNISLDDLLPEAFATVREAASRVLNMRHFDVQIIGGIILHRGMIAEMKTGEGKTLVATLAAYLNSLTEKGVHIVTVNDYLAKRDSEWMGKIYNFLDLSVGCIIPNLDEEDRKKAYAADITYGTNNEFGFDYLRDNMKYSANEMVQRPFNYAIIDEVDSILIDEARTPLIISGPAEDSSELYIKINKIIPYLIDEDYELDEKSKNIHFSEKGHEHLEKILKEHKILDENTSLFDFDAVTILHHTNQALKAHKIFNKDIDYIVKDNKVLIIDEFTGRMMEGRRFSEGLHQALEAKEHVKIQNENQTLASITFQNYFRLYPKISGMTGTAMTESAEFEDIYHLRVVEIPTNVAVLRKDMDDVIYLTAAEKIDAIINLIKECHERNQPILVGTVSIEKSELLSTLLKKHKLKHEVLNAHHHEREAFIIAQAGRPGSITIATNMAGRGTDIKLGGNPDMLIAELIKQGLTADSDEFIQQAKKITAQIDIDKNIVLEAGGLAVIGTERHESRRIDNQLRGRSGRQGDPGLTKFFLSLEDDLMRIFASERISGMLQKLGVKDGEAIHHPWITRALEKAQQRVESRNYDIRKSLLKFDDVMNDQRKVIYEQRKLLIEDQNIKQIIFDMILNVNEDIIPTYINNNSYAEQWDLDGLATELKSIYPVAIPLHEWISQDGIGSQELIHKINDAYTNFFKEKSEKFGEDLTLRSYRYISLMTLDQAWKEHLYNLDHMRHGIGLRAYGQKDPLNEYKRESFLLFKQMINEARIRIIKLLAHMEIRSDEDNQSDNFKLPVRKANYVETRNDPAMRDAIANHSIENNLSPVKTRNFDGNIDSTNPQTWGRVGRNDPCPCKSGKKFKNCHGQI